MFKFLGVFLAASILFGLFGSGSVSALFQPSDHGLDKDDFDPGHIIDDKVFTDSGTMSISDIQKFLEDNVSGGECDRWHKASHSSYQPPYTCLFEFQQNPTTGEHNYGKFDQNDNPAEVEGGLGAAEIIYDAAIEHKINPQVLLVLLQKEQSLITDNWPWTKQFSKATGYFCPDDAPCNPKSANFYKQVHGAAWQMRRYLDHTDNYWYAIGENNILYHPNTACGSKRVNIKNKATIALYLYTPYTPNEAALNNLFGTGNNCSAYGNRNFWTFFRYWFGSTSTSTSSADREYRNINHKVFKDRDLSYLITGNQLPAGEKIYFSLKFENLSSQRWNKDDISLLMFDSNEYPNCNQELLDCPKRVSLSSDVEKGDTAHFIIGLDIDRSDTEINKTFRLVDGNDNHLGGQVLALSFSVGQRPATDSTPPQINLNLNKIAKTIKATATDDSAVAVNTWGFYRIGPHRSPPDCSNLKYEEGSNNYATSFRDLKEGRDDGIYYYCFSVKDDSGLISHAISNPIAIGDAEEPETTEPETTSQVSSNKLRVVREGNRVTASGQGVENFEYVLMKVTDTACAKVDFTTLYSETRQSGSVADWRADRDFCFRARRTDNNRYAYGHLDQKPGRPAASITTSQVSSNKLRVIREGNRVTASGQGVENFEYVLMKVTDTACAKVDFTTLYSETRQSGSVADWRADRDFCFRARRTDNNRYAYGHLDQKPGRPAASITTSQVSSNKLRVVREGNRVTASGQGVENFEYVLMKVTDTACAKVDFTTLYSETRQSGSVADWRADRDFCFRARRTDNNRYAYGHLDQKPGRPAASITTSQVSSNKLRVIREGNRVTASGQGVENFEYVLMKVTDTACAKVDFTTLYSETRQSGSVADWRADRDFCFRARRTDNNRYAYGHLDQKPGRPAASITTSQVSSNKLRVVREGNRVTASGQGVENFEYVLMKVTDTACAKVDFTTLYSETRQSGSVADWRADRDFCFRARRTDNNRYAYGHLDQ